MNLQFEGRHRRDRQIRLRALQNFSLFTFTVLLGCSFERSLITLTGFDNHAFNFLLERFKPIYDAYTSYFDDGNIRLLLPSEKRGRPRSMTASQSLRTILTWYQTRGAEFFLSILFGITGSICSLCLWFCRMIIFKVLRSEQNAKVDMPCEEDVGLYQQALQEKRYATWCLLRCRRIEVLFRVVGRLCYTELIL